MRPAKLPGAVGAACMATRRWKERSWAAVFSRDVPPAVRLLLQHRDWADSTCHTGSHTGDTPRSLLQRGATSLTYRHQRGTAQDEDDDLDPSCACVDHVAGIRPYRGAVCRPTGICAMDGPDAGGGRGSLRRCGVALHRHAPAP